MKDEVLRKIKAGEIVVDITSYQYNGNTAVLLKDKDDFPYCALTVNTVPLDYGMAAIDINNIPWAEDFVKENGLGELIEYVTSGFCTYPVYKLNIDKLRALGKKVA